MELKCPYTSEQIIKELSEETWVYYNESISDQRLRFKAENLTSPILQEIHQYFHSDEVKKQIILSIFENKEKFITRWGMTPESMMTHSMLRAEFVKDLPGYHNGLHVDPRILFGTGMIYLNSESNLDRTTFFYDSAYRENPMTLDNSFGKGWFLANDENTWHDGWNKTKEIRYNLLLGLAVRLKEFDPRGSEYRYFVRPEHLIPGFREQQ